MITFLTERKRKRTLVLMMMMMMMKIPMDEMGVIPCLRKRTTDDKLRRTAA